MARREKDETIQKEHGLGGAEARELPNNVEAEQALLGAILVNNAAYARVSPFLEPQHFYEKLHQRIYMVAGEIINMGRIANPVMIKTFLPSKAKVGDMTVAQYVARLAAEAVTILNARDYGVAIHELWLARQAIESAEKFINFAYANPPGHDIVGDRTDLEDEIAALRAMRVKDENRYGMGRNYLEQLGRARSGEELKGVPIVLPEIRRVLSAQTFGAGRLTGMLGSSGEGKTSLMCQIILHALENGHPVQLHSFDQSKDELTQQLLAQAKQIEAVRQAEGDITEAEWGKAIDFTSWLDEQPYQVLEIQSATAPQLVTYARSFAKKATNYTDKVPLIVTDYVNAVDAAEPKEFQRRKQETEGTKAKEINKILKAGARSIGAAWLNLNQRNTEGMKRDNPRPIAADVYGGQSALYSYDSLFYIYRYMKFYKEAMKISAGRADQTQIASIYPSAVRQGEDIVEIGALKVRFGNAYVEPERLHFEGRFTRMKSIEEAVVTAADFSFLKQM